MTIKQLDTSLMGSYTIDSMMGGVSMKGISVELDDEPSIANYQRQAPKWCLHAEGYLLSEYIDRSSEAGIFISLMKNHMLNDYRDVEPMKYLYDGDDLDILVQKICELTMHAQFKEVQNLSSVPLAIDIRSIEQQSVSIGLALYIYFTLLNNPNVPWQMFNELFIKCWYDYYRRWRERKKVFQESGDHWRDQFHGVLCD